MARKPQITQDKISRIYALHKAGIGANAIQQQTGVPQRTVERWLQRCRAVKDDAAPVHLSKPGRPKKVNKRTLTVLKRDLSVRPVHTARELKENNPGLLGNVSLRTVSRYCRKELDLPSRTAARKPLLTPRHIANRLSFAKKYLQWPIEKIRSILWSDESVFTVSGTQFARVRRPKGSDRYDPKYTVKTVKHPDSVMIWGAFTYYGVGNLVFFEKGESVNSERYLELLYDNLEECYVKCKAECFMQDGAPCHTSKKVKEWLDNCEVDYIKDWPANSPDLNPIENLWSFLKNEIKKEDTSSLPKLKATLQRVWESLPQDKLQSLVDSVPRRLQAVIKKKGNTTRY